MTEGLTKCGWCYKIIPKEDFRDKNKTWYIRTQNVYVHAKHVLETHNAKMKAKKQNQEYTIEMNKEINLVTVSDETRYEVLQERFQRKLEVKTKRHLEYRQNLKKELKKPLQILQNMNQKSDVVDIVVEQLKTILKKM